MLFSICRSPSFAKLIAKLTTVIISHDLAKSVNAYIYFVFKGELNSTVKSLAKQLLVGCVPINILAKSLWLVIRVITNIG